MQARRLEVWQGCQAVGIERCVRTNPDGIVGIGATGGAFVTQGDFADASAFAKAAIDRERAFSVGFDGFVDGADDETCRDRTDLFTAWGKSVANEHDVGANFEGDEVIGRIETSRGVVVPVVVVFVGIVLILRETCLCWVQVERRFADDREDRAAALPLPKQRGDAERTDGNDVHEADDSSRGDGGGIWGCQETTQSVLRRAGGGSTIGLSGRRLRRGGVFFFRLFGGEFSPLRLINHPGRP